MARKKIENHRKSQSLKNSVAIMLCKNFMRIVKYISLVPPAGHLFSLKKVK